MRIALSACLLAATMIMAPSAMGQSKPLQIAKVVSEQTQLRAELESGSGRGANVSPAKRQELLKTQQDLLDMLAGAGEAKTTAQLSDQQRSFALETLALIDAAVESDDEEHVICKREKSLGSNMVKRTCRTLAQMRIEQERARAAFMDAARNN